MKDLVLPLPDATGPAANAGSALAVSVVVPVYNRADRIAATLRSIGPLPERAELIVVDDGSTDDSADRIRAAIAPLGPRARLIAQSNQGAAAARNRGVAHSRGAFIAFLDSDDLWRRKTLATCLDVALLCPEAALVFLQSAATGGPHTGPSGPGPLTIQSHPDFLAAVESGARTTFGAGAVMIRRSVFRALGGFSESFECAEDSDLFLRSVGQGDCILMLGTPLVDVQRAAENRLTSDAERVADGLRKMRARHRDGAYPGPLPVTRARRRFLATSAVYTARIAFAQGRPGLAYRILAGHLAAMLVHGQARWTWRLFLTPLLAQIRPRSYGFRLRPPAVRH